MRVLFVAPPFAGHLDRLVPLARAAVQAGHACRFVTGHARLGFLAGHGLAAEAPRSLPVGALERIAEGHGRVTGRPWRAWAQLRENLSLVPPLTDDLVALGRRWRADVIVADSVALMAGPAAMRLGVPWITTVASPLSLETRRSTPSFLGGLMPPQGRLGRMRDALGRAGHRWTRQAVFALHRKTVPPELARAHRPDGTEAIYSPHAILGFGLEELELPRDWPPAFEMIGPLHGVPTDDAPLELPEAPVRVLATLGTHLPWARADWSTRMAALAKARPDWQVVLSGGRMEGGAATEAANLLMVPRVCYHRDLPRFDVVVHHGGTGVAYAALAAGRPSVVVPQDYDQFDVAARLDRARVAVRRHGLRRPAAAVEAALALARGPLDAMAAAAARYDPCGRFLATLERVTGATSAAPA